MTTRQMTTRADTSTSRLPSNSRVAIARCPCYDPSVVRQAILQVLEPFGGMGAFVQAGARVVLKPNFVQGRPAERAANTHPVFIVAVAELVREYGGDPIVADSPGWGTAEGVARANGLEPLARRVGLPIVTLRDPVRFRDTRVSVRHLRVSATVRSADLVINLPKFKAHQQMLLTLGVKNVFGCVPGRRKAGLHMLSHDDRHWFARMLVENYLAVRPALTIMDGIVAMEGNGPSNGDPRPLGVVMAAADAVALDRVAVEIVGVPWQELTTLVAAKEMQAGCVDLERIELVGPSLESLRVSNFRLPLIMPISFSPMRILRGLIKNYLITLRHRREQLG
ncbi:MAG: DUF362 domain-containing protein [Candidatus Sumerlaeaceae bacterium]|nr:DUF362 domain-containing protein [Candidatus Sumerlaeaceae bacterium]